MDKIITLKEYEETKKEAHKKIKARNNAVAAITDAKARYIKKKTGARSKKAATEKDALAKAKKYDCLGLYERREDIREYYGYGGITESECDRLEALWDEREEILKKTEDGIYRDTVTDLLDAAISYTYGAFEDEIAQFDGLEHDWQKQVKEAEEWHRQEHEKYKAWKNGWGEYAPKKEAES